MDSSINGGKPAIMKAVFRRDVAARTAGAISASAGGYTISDTSTTAKVGDVCRFETGTLAYKEYSVIAASTNSFTIASKELPTLGDTFFILGPVNLRLGGDGAISVSIAGGATEAKQDVMITSLQLIDNAISGNEMQVDIVSSALPTGAATEAGLTQILGELQTKAGVADTQPVSLASVPLPTGASTSALQSTIDTSINTLLKPASTLNAVTTVGAVTAITNALPAGTNNIGDVDIASIAAGDNNIGNVDVVTLPALPAGTNNIGDVDVLTLPVAFNAGTVDATTQRVVSSTGSTPTTANVSGSATSVTLLAASTGRLGATFYNDSSANLYLKFGATASTTSFTVLILPNGFYELPGPNIYNGIIDGIWSSATGACRVTSWAV